MINNKFKAIFNPFNRRLAVLYGDCITEHTFEDIEEWFTVSFNGSSNHPNYLHIQLDYDESLQLLFYPREEGDPSLHEDKGVYFNSSDMNKIPNELTIVYNDSEWNKAYWLDNF